MSSSQKYIKTNDSNETRIALLEQSIGHIGQTLIRIESRIDNLDKSLNGKIDDLGNKLNGRIDKIDNRLWQIMFLISSSIIGVIIGKIFHWF